MKLALFYSVLALALAAAFGDERLEKLSSDHRTWLEEEVAYIITEKEREVFLSLETLEERRRFIQAFWKKRDPNPVTPENERQAEHYRRLRYANEVLGRESPRPGWRTDRGKYYILLGKPQEIQRFESAEVVSSELWFYESDPSTGLPPYFYLLFFRRNNIGEYELYHPVADGPKALLYGRAGWNDRMALPVIDEVSQELTRASLSFDPSDPPDLARAQASPRTDLLLARIEESPERSVATDYLDAFLRYRNRVSADYSFNYVPSRALFAVLTGPEHTPFVHFSIEIDPQHFNLETDEAESRYYTTVEVTIELRGSDGALVVSKDREIFVELSPDQFRRAQAFPVAFHDVFPLVPGDYEVSVILKNRVLTQYTVAERKLTIEPLMPSKPRVRAVVLGFDGQMRGRVETGEVRPFYARDVQLHPTAEGVFAIGDTAFVLAELEGAVRESRLVFRVLDGEDVLLQHGARLGEGSNRVVLERLSLDGIPGGRYELRAELLSPAGDVQASRSTPLVISPRTALERFGFVSRRGFNASVPGLLALEKGEQYSKLGDFERAEEELKRAAAANNPDLPSARWQLASVLLSTGEVERSLQILIPLESLYPEQFEVIAGIGFGYYFKRSYERARSYLERAMTLRPPTTTLLNALGDCHERLGDPGKARRVFERSLELDASQDKVAKRLAALDPR